MSLKTGNNQVSIKLTDSDTGEIRSELNFYCMDYENVIEFEEALLNMLMTLGHEKLDKIK